MPNIYLGPPGAETLLPAVNWRDGASPELPVGVTKQIVKSTMIDGTTRYNFKTISPKTFQLEWALLAGADVLTLLSLAEYNGRLRFQNNWQDAVWRFVAITSITVAPVQETFAMAAAKYHVTVTLEEIR